MRERCSPSYRSIVIISIIIIIIIIIREVLAFQLKHGVATGVDTPLDPKGCACARVVLEIDASDALAAAVVAAAAVLAAGVAAAAGVAVAVQSMREASQPGHSSRYLPWKAMEGHGRSWKVRGTPRDTCARRVLGGYSEGVRWVLRGCSEGTRRVFGGYFEGA